MSKGLSPLLLFRMVARVFLEGLVILFRSGAFRPDAVKVWVFVRFSEPGAGFPHHFPHVGTTGAVSDVLPVQVGHVPGKNVFKALRLFNRAAEFVQVLLRLPPDRARRAVDAAAIFLLVQLTGVERNDVFGRSQDVTGDCIRKGTSDPQCCCRRVLQPCRARRRGNGCLLRSGPGASLPGSGKASL